MRPEGKPLPLPVRVAAGLAVSAAENARRLPRTLVELPISVVSQALQTSMRVQQEITQLAIRGDDALATFRPVAETPEWATFDEDLHEPITWPDRPAERGRRSAWDEADTTAPDPWAAEQQALAEEHQDGEFDTQEPAPSDTVVPDGEAAPAAFPDYAELSLPQLRARLRTFSEAELGELLDYERSHLARPQFIGMLTRRIATVRGQR